MIQSRFQKQHASKHPQRPENGGSGPVMPPVSRDATSNIRKNAAVAADATRRNSLHDYDRKAPGTLSTMDEHGVEDIVRNLSRPVEHMANPERPLPKPREQYKDRLPEGREQALRGAAAKARTRADAELDTAFNQYGGKLGQATYGDKAGADYKRSDALNAEADSLFRGRTRGKKKPKAIDEK